MKKALLLSAAVAMFLFSCKKDRSGTATTPAGKKYVVTFNVTNFTQRVGAFSIRHKNLASGDTLSNIASYLDVLYYVVLDSHNNPVKEKYQDSTMAGMGMITDTLPAGNYTIGIAAGKKGMQATATFGIGTFFDYGNSPWQDTFFDSFPLTVGTSNISQDVTLSRTVGKLEVLVRDTIPATADSLIVSFDGDATNKGFFDGTAGNHKTTTFHFAIPASARGTTNFDVDNMLLGGVNFGSDVTVTCIGAGNGVIVSSTYSPVTVFANEKTIMSIDLFRGINTSPGSNQQSFTTKVDTAWNSTPNQISFSLRRH